MDITKEEKEGKDGKEGKEDNDVTASGNLDNNKINTTIEPKTDGNYVYISVCSCSVNCNIS